MKNVGLFLISCSRDDTCGLCDAGGSGSARLRLQKCMEQCTKAGGKFCFMNMRSPQLHYIGLDDQVQAVQRGLLFNGDAVTGFGAVDTGFMHISYSYLTLALRRSVIGTHSSHWDRC